MPGMGDDKRRAPEGSLEEEHIAESVLYGLLGSMLNTMAPVINENFNFLGAEVHQTSEIGTGVYFDGLTIHMASGDYEVTIKRTKVN
jgi:hypothetical protein